MPYGLAFFVGTSYSVNFFVAGRLLRLARQELRERALVSSRAPDLRSL